MFWCQGVNSLILHLLLTGDAYSSSTIFFKNITSARKEPDLKIQHCLRAVCVSVFVKYGATSGTSAKDNYYKVWRVVCRDDRCSE